MRKRKIIELEPLIDVYSVAVWALLSNNTQHTVRGLMGLERDHVVVAVGSLRLRRFNDFEFNVAAREIRRKREKAEDT
jgi:hypothetical protein